MKKIYCNFISQEDLDKENIFSIGGRKFKVLETSQDSIAYKVINAIKEDFNFSVKDESYWRVEERSGGHQWHKDTGSSNHMMWCEVGISIILKKSASGGDTYYGDNAEGLNAEKVDRDLFDLVAHTSDEWHMVEPNSGGRIVFLMFI